jgi:23S rRNA (guanine2535-N1)-methyltransferase
VAYRLTSRTDHGDLASGLVLRSAPGFPAFPVRLAQELFLRGAQHLPGREPLGLWDPCCGSGYLATVVALRHRDRLRHVLCSDIDPAAVALAGRNLALLTAAGLAERAAEPAATRPAEPAATRPTEPAAERATEPAAERAAEPAAARPGRADAARRLAAGLGADLPSAARIADAFDPAALAAILPSPPPDLVLTDVPYGRQTTWQGRAGAEPLPALARSLSAVLPDHAVLVLSAQTRRIHLGTGIRALDRIRTGTRAAAIIRAGALR